MNTSNIGTAIVTPESRLAALENQVALLSKRRRAGRIASLLGFLAPIICSLAIVWCGLSAGLFPLIRTRAVFITDQSGNLAATLGALDGDPALMLNSSNGRPGAVLSSTSISSSLLLKAGGGKSGVMLIATGDNATLTLQNDKGPECWSAPR